MKKKEEMLVITMEECGELIQACSKMIRFDEPCDTKQLQEEIGDVMCMIEILKDGGLVTDDDHVEGTASSIANELSIATGKVVRTMGLKPRTAGFHPSVDNLPPTAEEIINKLKEIKHGI